ncbi:MAG: hypothetical protein IT221_09445, partial [Fluviicola sp.]|nr:hypothetical protein [Fluviicola sp.]
MHKGITIKGLYNANDTLYITSVNSSLFVSDLTNAANKNIVYDSVVFLNSLSSAIKCYESNSLTIMNSSFKNCQSPFGGAIILGYLSQTISANFTVHNSTFENCTATTQRGGAILIQSKSSINAEISNSTFIDNQSIMDGGAICAESILNGSPVFIQVDNSTFFSNHASSGSDISIKSQYTNGNCQLELTNSSFVQATGNSSFYFGYDVNASTPSSITFGSSILSPNTTNLIAFGVPNNPFTNMNSLGYNVFNSTLNLGGTIATDQTGITSAQLNISAPAINGGTTKTCYLNAPSIAINAGNPLDMSAAQNGPVMEGIRDVGSCESTPIGEMLSFDGQNDGVYGNAINTGGDYFTLEMMVKPSTSSDPLAYLIYNGTPGVNGYGLVLDPSTNEVLLEIGGSPLQSTGYLLNTGTWTHLAYTYNMGTNKLYANGSLEFSFSSSAIAPPTTHFFLGTAENSQHSFGGEMDEVRVWNRELCLSEIIHHQSCEIHEIMISLMANYHFNQGLDAMNNFTYSTLNDSSGYSNYLTLDNFALNGTTSNWLKGSSIPSFISCSDFQEVVNYSTINNVACAGDNDGFIYLNTIGGQGPYTYDWNPGNTSTDTLTDLTAGTYEVVTSDVNGCKTNDTFIIEELSNLSSSTYYDSIPCFGSTTTMYIAISGGLAPYYYNWNTNQTTFNVPNVTAGNYTCEVTDSRG